MSRVWTCAEPDFRFSWMKLCSIVITNTPWHHNYRSRPSLAPPPTFSKLSFVNIAKTDSSNSWNLTISCQYLRRWWRAKLLSQEIGTANQVYKGEAKKLVKDCIQQPTKVFYNNAKNLQIKYGNPHKIFWGYQSEIKKWPKVRQVDSTAYRKICNFLLRCQSLPGGRNWNFFNNIFNLRCVIAHAYASTQASSLMHVKYSMHHFCLWHCLRHWGEENEKKIKSIKLNSWSILFNLPVYMTSE